MKEIWKDVVGYENLYKVSNLGNIYSLMSNKIISFGKKRAGYLFVNLYKNGNHKTKHVHRLVAEAFIPNPESKPQVNHIDGNKQNNCVDNLEWCTCKENMEHASKHNLVSRKYGEDNIFSKKVIQLDLNYQPIKIWNSTGEITRKLKIPKQHISNVCNNKRYQTRNYIFLWYDDYLKILDLKQYINARKKRFKHRRKKVMCIDTNIIYENATEAQRYTGANRTTIVKCCEGKRKTSGGLNWKYANE